MNKLFFTFLVFFITISLQAQSGLQFFNTCDSISQCQPTGDCGAIEVTLSNFATTNCVNPLVNYNIISFDQNLKNNSSVYFINLNTSRFNSFTDANVSAVGLNLVSKQAKMKKNPCNSIDFYLFSNVKKDSLKAF